MFSVVSVAHAAEVVRIFTVVGVTVQTLVRDTWVDCWTYQKNMYMKIIECMMNRLKMQITKSDDYDQFLQKLWVVLKIFLISFLLWTEIQ